MSSCDSGLLEAISTVTGVEQERLMFDTMKVGLVARSVS